MLNEDDDDGDLPDQWWLLAIPAWAPAFFYFWLERGEQFKGSVIGGVLGGIVIACGFFTPRFKRPLFWIVVALICVIQIVPLCLLSIPNFKGASFGILFPLVLIEVGISYYLLELTVGPRN